MIFYKLHITLAKCLDGNLAKDALLVHVIVTKLSFPLKLKVVVKKKKIYIYIFATLPFA